MVKTREEKYVLAQDPSLIRKPEKETVLAIGLFLFSLSVIQNNILDYNAT